MEAATTVQLNVRIPHELKSQGDEVLARVGLSASEAVRRLWSHLAARQDIPACLKDAAASDEADALAARLVHIDEAAELFASCCRACGVESAPAAWPAEEQHRALYEALLEDYESLPC